MEDRPAVRGLNHVAVVVSDLDRSESFYRDVLGLALLERHHDEHGRHRSTWVALDETTFMALERASAATPKRSDESPGFHCVALEIRREDRRRWLEHLGAHALPVERRTRFTIYVRDPDGVLVGLRHYPDPIDLDDELRERD